MTYAQLIQKLYQVNLHGGVKLGLNNTYILDEALGNPSEKFESIHVAGSNGKGSVVTKIAKSLQIVGHRVGLYTSPHISCFRERIRINGEMIPESSIERILPQIFEIVEKQNIPATFFEITTLLAFKYFADENIDIAVLETGIGGRLDSTNIVQPKLSVITSISIEHAEILGETIEKITTEKCGIIKPRTPVVIGPNVPFNVVSPIADQQHSPLVQVSGRYATYDAENRAIAMQALETLELPQAAIIEGTQALPPCRMERVYVPGFSEKVILDVAHNPDGLEHLFASIPKEPYTIVFGLSKTKDIQGCLDVIKKHGAAFYLVEARNGRGVSVDQLKKMLLDSGMPEEKIHVEDNIADSIKKAMCEKRSVLITGTFFIMSDARAALGINEPRDPFDMNEAASSLRSKPV